MDGVLQMIDYYQFFYLLCQVFPYFLKYNTLENQRKETNRHSLL